MTQNQQKSKKSTEFPFEKPFSAGWLKRGLFSGTDLALSPTGMKTLQTLLMVLLLGSALQSQTAWASWNIYRDSTGSGADPVDGGLLCLDDTVWLIVDTTGMDAAGITGWRWRYRGAPPMVVHCEGSECPTSWPYYFPYSGLPNKLKVGVRVSAPTTYI